MKRHSFVLAFVVLLGGLQTVTGQSHEYSVDLPATFGAPAAGSVPIAQRAGPPGLLVEPHGAQHPAIPFTVTLQSFDAPQYYNADTFKYLVKLVYTGSGPMKFPVFTDRSFFVRDSRDVRKATVGLRIQNTDLDPDCVVMLPTAYGSDAVTGSVITVQPGDSIIVRTMGLWNIPNLKTPRNVALKAEVGLYGYSGEYAKQPSGNTLSVALEPR